VASPAHDWLVQTLRDQRAVTSEPPTLAEDRAQLARYAERSVTQAGVTVTVTEIDECPGSLLFTPSEVRDDLALVHIHGGGFRVGSPANDRHLAGVLALATRARVLSPAYRLAPEHPYPAGLDDCERAYEYAAALLPEAGIVVGGGSAGASLAAALLLQHRDAGDRRPLGNVLFSGIYDLDPTRYSRGSWLDNATTDVILHPDAGLVMTVDYLGERITTPRVGSPLAADLAGLPPLFIQASGAEMLLDDSLRLAEKAARAGVETTLEIWPEMLHAWQGMAGLLPEAAEALHRAADFIDRVVNGRVANGFALREGPDLGGFVGVELPRPTADPSPTG